MIIALLVLGFWMTDRAGANLWDELTNALYAWHKLIGFFVLVFTALRIMVKSLNKRPDYPSDISKINFEKLSYVCRSNGASGFASKYVFYSAFDFKKLLNFGAHLHKA
jgi:hypothetical protein